MYVGACVWVCACVCGVCLRWITFLERNRALYDPRYAVNPVKQWLVYLKVYYPQAAALFSEVKRITDPDDMALALQGRSALARAA